jgi:hypothetical protein
LQISLDADVSLPTGKSRLRGRERNVVFDPLLARYDRYGEGLNYSAGVSAALSIVDELSLAVGVRFTGTGKYRPDGDSPAIEINPGDTPALSAHVVWRRGQDVLSFGAEVADERVARRNGIALLDRGRTVELSLTGAVTPAAGWTMTGAAFYTKREKDRRLDEVTGKFELEQSRLHGDIWAVAIAAYRQVSRRTAIGVEGDFALAGDSELDDADFSYLPARRRWRLGIGLKHQLGNRVNLKAVGRYVDYRDQGSRLLIPLDASGVNFTLGVSTSF